MPFGLNVYTRTKNFVNGGSLLPGDLNSIQDDLGNRLGLIDTAPVSSLPGAPVNGQEVIYNANITDGVIWRFKYRAASPNTKKWEFQGGAPLYTQILTQELIGSQGAWVNLATIGPDITVPLTGDYLARYGAHCFKVTANTTSLDASIGVAVSDGTPATNLGHYQNGLTTSHTSGGNLGNETTISFTSGQIARLRYFIVASAAGGNFIWRWLQLTPIRVI